MGGVIQIPQAVREAQAQADAREHGELVERFLSQAWASHRAWEPAALELAKLLATEILNGRRRLLEFGKEHGEAMDALRLAHAAEIEALRKQDAARAKELTDEAELLVQATDSLNR